MITVEMSQRSLDAEVKLLESIGKSRASSDLYVSGALSALRWILNGEAKPSDSIYVQAHLSSNRPEHKGWCGNQNVLHPDGKFIDAEFCNCQHTV